MIRRIRVELVARGWSVEQLADRAGWNRSEVWGLIRGEYDLNGSFLSQRVPLAFGVKRAEFFEGGDPFDGRKAQDERRAG